MSTIETPIEGKPPPATPLLRTLVIADLVEAAALTEKLGDVRAIEIFRKHDRIGRDLVTRHGGREIDKTDGFLVLFDRPIRAIAFALEYQRALRTLGRGEAVPLSARVGIHVGDVLIWENSADDIAQGAKPVEVEGLVKPIAARLMGLALPGQVLMTGVANTLAQRARDELGERAASVRFKYHGRYQFKGVADALPVYEVGEPGISPLKRPPPGDKAWRELPWWRRPRALALEALGAAAVAAVLFWIAGHPEPAIAFAARDWVVVGDLRNLTAEKDFDDALDAAIRVSLEQSRFVNLVSDLQVRDALVRMTRAPGTPIDRTVGAEIALREGARALILPTVAEVGGRIRVSAEVVDPHTQATVYAQSADGSGAGSALGSVDKVTRELRGKLGEAMQSIESDSAPLPKVTTANLDALRAYALGWRANIEGRWADALPLYAEAAKLDPGFALAYLGMARIEFGADDRSSAFRHLTDALAHRDRLPARERLYLDAWLANFGAPRETLARWKLVATVYPDTFWAHSNYALFALHYTSHFEDALAAVEPATSPFNPFRRSAYYLRGTLLLALDRHADALASYQTARELGVSGSLLDLAYAHAVGRDYARAEAVMAGATATGVASSDVFDRMFVVVEAVDRGRWDAAAAAARANLDEARRVGALPGRVFEEAALGLASLAHETGLEARLEAALATEAALLADPHELERNHAGYACAFIAYLAARAGLPALAERALAIATPVVPSLGFPNADSMLVVARSAAARAAGSPTQALLALQSLDPADDLYQAHVVRMTALRDLDRDAEALVEADWLAARRGRAYAERGSYAVVRALDVADSNLALLAGAEIATKLGRADDARARRVAFDAAWPEARAIPWLARRMASSPVAAP